MPTELLRVKPTLTSPTVDPGLAGIQTHLLSGSEQSVRVVIDDAPPFGPPGKPAPLNACRYGPLRVALLHGARGDAAGVVPVLRASNLVQEVRKRAAGSGVVARLPGSARTCCP